MLEHLQTYFDLLMGSFDRLESSGDFFMDSFTRTALKSVLSLVTFFSKYLSSEQYEQVIKRVLLISGTF